MARRTDILAEMQARLAALTSGPVVLMNPKTPPNFDSLPLIILVSGVDDAEETDTTGDYPIYKRDWDVFMYVFIAGSDSSDDELAAAEIDDYVDTCKKVLYAGEGTLVGNLNKTCVQLRENGTDVYLKVPGGGSGIGLLVHFSVTYLEDIGALFV